MQKFFLNFLVGLVVTSGVHVAARASCDGYGRLAISVAAERRLAELHPRVAAWIRETALRDAQQARPNVPSIYFKGEMLPVVARLGHGTQAVVYLVETSQGLRAAKVFRQPHKFTRGLREIRDWTRNSLPAVIDADEDAITALFEYREGIPVGVLAADPSHFGLSPSEFDSISKEFTKQSTFAPDTDQAMNYVYSFKDKSVQQIDPY